MLASAALSQRFADKSDRSRHIPQNEHMREPEDTEAEPSELYISASITLDTAGVTTPIHFYDELDGWRQEIRNEFSDDDLAAKRHSKLTSAELPPESSFDSVQVAAHGSGAIFEQPSSFLFKSSHESLPSAAAVPSFEVRGAGCVTRPCTFPRPRLPLRISCSPRRQRGAQRAPLRRSSAPTLGRYWKRRELEVNLECQWEHRVHLAPAARHLQLTPRAARGAGSTAFPPFARSEASTDKGADRPPGAARGRGAQQQSNSGSPPDERGHKHQFRIFAGSRQVAQIEKVKSGSTVTRSVRYLHSDRLGSPTHVTDETGKVVSQRNFTVFGASSASGPAGALDTGYTGHREDPELGLINMRGRIYDPGLRQFLSADPYVQFPAFSQSWNRYSYVLNNPTRYTDPSGYQTVPADGGAPYVDGGTGGGGEGGNSGGSGKGVAEGANSGGGAGGSSGGNGAQGGGSIPHYGRDRGGDGGSNGGDSWFEEFADYVGDVAVETARGTVCGLVGGSWDCQSANAPITGKETEKRPSLLEEGLGLLAGAMGLGAILKGKGKGGEGPEAPNAAQHRKLSAGEIKQLKKAGVEPHDLKPKVGGSKLDLFKTPEGDVVVKPKDGSGPGEPTGINLNEL